MRNIGARNVYNIYPRALAIQKAQCVYKLSIERTYVRTETNGKLSGNSPVSESCKKINQQILSFNTSLKNKMLQLVTLMLAN